MRILITGSSGLVGSALLPALTTAGHSVTRLMRGQPWPDLASHDAVVNLAGDNIGSGRWTPAKKARIRDSRVQLARQLAQSLARLTPPPKVSVSASAIGFYGNRGDGVLREESLPESDFLSSVCREWEAATKPAGEAAGGRVSVPVHGTGRRAEALVAVNAGARYSHGGGNQLDFLHSRECRMKQ